MARAADYHDEFFREINLAKKLLRMYYVCDAGPVTEKCNTMMNAK